MKIYQGPESFSSGNLVKNDKFLHRFEKEGEYYVRSEGATKRNEYCLVKALKNPKTTKMPKLYNIERENKDEKFEPKNNAPQVLTINHIVRLKCDTPFSEIYYTINGLMPSELSKVGLYIFFNFFPYFNLNLGL